MRKNILITSFDMDVGGVERSLINMLDNFNYQDYKVDLLLYKQQGEFLKILTNKVNLLDEIPELTTFRMSIGELFRKRNFKIASSRTLSKFTANVNGKLKGLTEPGYYQMQLMWKYTLPFLPRIDKEYEVAISYLWPHYYIAKKIKAKKKIAWIHTDYSTIDTDIDEDLGMWSNFDHIIAVSEACKESFLNKYPQLSERVQVIENITSPQFIKKMSNEELDNPMLYDNRFKLLTVARLSHAKGIDNAVKALKLLRVGGFDNIAWYIVGYGGDEEKIKKLIKENDLQNSFILLGKQTNPYPYMKACDLYVQPSRYEGKAVTVTEAKILAKPILITNYNTAKSQIENYKDGVICDQSVECLADGIKKLYLDLELRKSLITYVKQKDHSNLIELDKLYNLV